MNTGNYVRGTLQFTLFNIPVAIHPFSWLILALLGLSFSNGGEGSLQSTLIFIVVGMLTILAHEFGHALVGRAYTRVTPYVEIGGMGGVTHHPVGMPNRKSQFMMVLAGPMASFVLGLVFALLMGILVGNLKAGFYCYLCEPLDFIFTIRMPEDVGESIVQAIQNGNLTLAGLRFFLISFVICFWWTVFNLLPIFPMDGGQLLLTASKQPRFTAIVGLVLSSLLALYFVSGGSIFMTLLMGYFAWINWKILTYKER